MAQRPLRPRRSSPPSSPPASVPQQVLHEWRAIGGPDRRAIGFCCTIAHAEFMADYFRSEGVAAVAVHSGPSSASRTATLERLASGQLPVAFTVDLFNEGVDVPRIDLVMMLRPTESGVVFIQQLGRGLRRSDQKERLDVIDLVGNHRGFLLKARLLAARGPDGPHRPRAVALLSDQANGLAIGRGSAPRLSIIVEPEAIDLLSELTRVVSQADRLAELIREWTDAHAGVRPTAIQTSLAYWASHQSQGPGRVVWAHQHAGSPQRERGEVLRHSEGVLALSSSTAATRRATSSSRCWRCSSQVA